MRKQKIVELVNPVSKYSGRIVTSASLLALCVMGVVTPAVAQDEDASDLEEVVVTGMRSSLQSAQNIKRDANTIVDSIVAEDIGKLPDRSIAEALQRIPGVAVSRFDQPGDPEHFAGEGAGVSVRGFTQVRAELNGRDIFSANDGRSLSFDDVPAELMAGVDVHKTPTADMIEGGLGGIVNLRTRMPFDSDDQVISATLKGNYGDTIKELNTEASGLYSNVWATDIGRVGFLLDLSTSQISSRADNLYNRAYFPVEGITDSTAWVPKGSDWRRNDYARKRDGQYVALQWAPVESTEFYFTGFKSKAERDWYENAFFLDAGSFPEPPENSDWIFDNNNALVSGTLTSPTGIALGTSSRISANQSSTSDLSSGVKWTSVAWSVDADFQYIKSTAKRQDYTLGTVVSPPSVRVSNLHSKNGPTIEDTGDTLGDLSQYAYGQMMTRPADNKATSKAAKVDVTYDFEDSLISSVKAGARYAKKEAVNKDATSWAARVQPWNTWVWGDDLPTIQNEDLMQEYSFTDFQRGDANVPVDAWMFKREALSDFNGTTQAMAAATTPPEGMEWATSMPDLIGNDNGGGANLNHPLNSNSQEDITTAAYIMANFDINDRFGGNFGLRYVDTAVRSVGAMTAPGIDVGTGENLFSFPPQPMVVEHDYQEVLPSMNLRYNMAEDVVLRFSASQALWKPEFWRTAAIATLSTSWRDDIPEDERPENPTVEDFQFSFSTNDTNPELDPMKATQFDLSAEWYFNDDGGMLYGALFTKKATDFFRTENARAVIEGLNVSWDRAVNVGSADVKGYEVGGTYYFDFLPQPFKGFGITANYTNIDSSTEVGGSVSVAATDTDGSMINGLPFEGLADNSYNLAFMYENYGLYARLAYAYNSETLQTVGPNGWSGEDNNIAWGLPVYADAYGQWDFSMGYDINDHVSVNFEAYNLAKAKTKGVLQQNSAGNHTAFVYSQDTRYGLSLRVTY